jgi:hypothetical protein
MPRKEKQHAEPSTNDEVTQELPKKHMVEVYTDQGYQGECIFDSEEDARLYYDQRLLTAVKIGLKEDKQTNFSIHWYVDGELKREYAIEHSVYEI